MGENELLDLNVELMELIREKQEEGALDEAVAIQILLHKNLMRLRQFLAAPDKPLPGPIKDWQPPKPRFKADGTENDAQDVEESQESAAAAQEQQPQQTASASSSSTTNAEHGRRPSRRKRTTTYDCQASTSPASQPNVEPLRTCSYAEEPYPLAARKVGSAGLRPPPAVQHAAEPLRTCSYAEEPNPNPAEEPNPGKTPRAGVGGPLAPNRGGPGGGEGTGALGTLYDVVRGNPGGGMFDPAGAAGSVRDQVNPFSAYGAGGGSGFFAPPILPRMPAQYHPHAPRLPVPPWPPVTHKNSKSGGREEKEEEEEEEDEFEIDVEETGSPAASGAPSPPPTPPPPPALSVTHGDDGGGDGVGAVTQGDVEEKRDSSAEGKALDFPDRPILAQPWMPSRLPTRPLDEPGVSNLGFDDDELP